MSLVPEYMYGQVQNILDCQQTAAERSALWATILKLVPVKDGDEWCVLYGENLQTGVAAFGKTPDLAMYHFDEAFASKEGSKQ